MNDQDTIYSDSDHTWFFLVPEGLDLPAGDFTIISLLGREMQVDPDALELYVVPRELAEAYLSGQVREGLESVQQSVMGFLHTLRNSQREATSETRWNVDFLADLLNQPQDAVKHDPAATRQGLQDLFAEAALFFERVKSGDEANIAQAREQIMDYADLLRWHGIEVDEKVADVPDVLAESYRQRRNL